ncbi:MAG: hypothetical protein QM619_06845 [Micropruina sp.]|uniref:hypothetical protein n=1 Tax=Micropruina sp. TaxID=2737536 RepID=UPI0039E5502E
MSNASGNGWPPGAPPQGPGSNTNGGTPPWQPGGTRPYGQGYPPPPSGAQPNPQPPSEAQPPSGWWPGHPADSRPDAQTTPGFDPRQALGPQPLASVSINQFAPPPNRTPLLITLVALITLVLVIGGGIYVRSLAGNQPAPGASATPTATAAGPGHPFTTPDGRRSGRWEILDSTWTDEGLQLQLRIFSDSGSIDFSFMAFSNASTDLVTPTGSPRSPDLQTGTSTPGHPATGYVFFPMPKGDATIILANGSGRQMSALPVKG